MCGRRRGYASVRSGSATCHAAVRCEAALRSDPELTKPGGEPLGADGETGGAPRRKWLWLLAGAAVLIGVIVLFSRSSSGTAKPAKGDAVAVRAVPVVATAVKVGDLGVYLNGLGTATAVNTVTVRSRIDGQLVSVAFREGQLVHAGELLAQIDPRPFQVQLQQAEAQSARQGALDNANVIRAPPGAIQQDAVHASS